MSDNVSLMTKEESSDKLIPVDVSLPSQFLLPNLDDSSSENETKITELRSEADLPDTDKEEEIPLEDSGADSLVDTKELLECIDTMDMGETEVNSSDPALVSDMIQDDVVPDSDSDSFIPTHEVESFSLDPSTNEQELSKSHIEECTQMID